MQQIYSNQYKNYTVQEIWDEFEQLYANYPRDFADVMTPDSINDKVWKLNWFPIVLEFPPVVNVYASEATYNTRTIESTLTE